MTQSTNWYHTTLDKLIDWLNNRNWRRRQAEFARTGTRYYGDGGTIHQTSSLEVEIYSGRVVAVWFRCQALPFKAVEANATRSCEMARMYVTNPPPEIRGVEVLDRKKENLDTAWPESSDPISLSDMTNCPICGALWDGGYLCLDCGCCPHCCEGHR